MASSLTSLAWPIPAATLARVRPLSRREPWVIFGVSFLLYAFVGWVGAYVLETYNWDGVTRIAQAHGIIFSRDPHLAALGFIWPPLPALTDLPILVMLKPLGLILLTGPVMSAFYGAFALVQLSEILRRFDVPLFWRIAWTAAFGAHKLIAHNAAMGLSEAPFLAFLLMSVNGFVKWERDRQPSGLVWAAIGAALALYCRYEALAWTAVMAMAIMWRLRFDAASLWRRVTGGSILAFITPSVWALILWILVNWDITGNPMYFLVGPGSTGTTPDTAHIVGPEHPFYFAYGSVAGSGILLMHQTLSLAPLLLLATPLLMLCVVWRQRWSDLAYLALGWSILGFTFMIALRGLLPPWARYFFWAVPAGVIVAGAAYRAAETGWPRRCVALGVTLLLLIPAVGMPLQVWPKLSEPWPLRAVAAIVLAPEVKDSAGAHGQFDEFVAMASYLDAQPTETLTMIDASVGSPIVFFLKRPDKLVMTTDTDFLPILRDPVDRVDQVLVPFPSFDAKGRSDILKLYPDLYEGGQPWARLTHEFPGPSAWRLFEVQQTETDDY